MGNLAAIRQPSSVRRGAPINPFSTRYYRPGTIPYMFASGTENESPAKLFDRFLEAGRKGQLVGKEGTGKSTLLRELESVARRLDYEVIHVQLREDSRRMPPGWWRTTGPCPAEERILFLDGAEQLGRLAFLLLRLRCRALGIGLLITTHHPLGLPALRQHAVDEEQAREITRRVLAACPSAPPLVAPEEITVALKRSAGNMREALFVLYDLYEERWAAS